MDRIKMLEIVEDLVYRGRDLGDACLAVAERHDHEEEPGRDEVARWLEEEWEHRNGWNPGPDCATRTGMYDAW